jgi:hypothetical protein
MKISNCTQGNGRNTLSNFFRNKSTIEVFEFFEKADPSGAIKRWHNVILFLEGNYDSVTAYPDYVKNFNDIPYA